MNKQLLRLSVLLIMQSLLALPMFAGAKDSTEVEHDKKIDFNREVVLDEIDRLLLIEYGAIWDPLSLEEEAEGTCEVSGRLDEEGGLHLTFATPLGQSLVEIYRQGLRVTSFPVSGSGGESYPLGVLHPGHYTVLVSPEEEPDVCYVGRFTVE